MLVVQVDRRRVAGQQLGHVAVQQIDAHARQGHRGHLLGDRPGAQRQLRHHAEHVQVADHEACHVVAGDVLDRPPADVLQLALPVDQGHAQQHVAHRAEAQPQRAVVVVRHDLADAQRIVGPVDRQPLVVWSQRRGQVVQRGAGPDLDGHVGHVMLDDAAGHVDPHEPLGRRQAQPGVQRAVVDHLFPRVGAAPQRRGQLLVARRAHHTPGSDALNRLRIRHGEHCGVFRGERQRDLAPPLNRRAPVGRCPCEPTQTCPDRSEVEALPTLSLLMRSDQRPRRAMVRRVDTAARMIHHRATEKKDAFDRQ